MIHKRILGTHTAFFTHESQPPAITFSASLHALLCTCISIYSGCQCVILGDFVTQVRVRELVHERPVYRIEGSGTNHPDDPLDHHPWSVSVFTNNVIYTIESNTGIIRLGSNGPTYIRIGGRDVSNYSSFKLFVYQVPDTSSVFGICIYNENA